MISYTADLTISDNITFSTFAGITRTFSEFIPKNIALLEYGNMITKP